MINSHGTSLNRKLKKLLRTLSDQSKNTELIAINASISASQMDDAEGRAFKEIAHEMRRLNTKSGENLIALDEVLEEVKVLSKIINKAGRQRMLAQQILKLRLLTIIDHAKKGEYQHDMEKSVQLFENSLKQLATCPLNDDLINSVIAKGLEKWNSFKAILYGENINNLAKENDMLVLIMNDIVEAYEQLAG